MAGARRLEVIYFTGDPDGLRQISIRTSQIRTYIVPRKLLSEAKGLPDITRPGVYFLINESDTSKIKKMYIGKTTLGIARMDEHKVKKGFWDKAILFLSDEENFDMTIISGLEQMLINKAIACNRYDMENAQPSKVKIKGGVLYDLQNYAEDIEFTMATLGYSFSLQTEDENEIFAATRKGLISKMIYHGERIELLKGSEINMALNASSSFQARREKMIQDKYIIKVGDKFILQKSIDFTSPSSAADFAIGGSNNGWLTWKRSTDGKTLDEIYRVEE